MLLPELMHVNAPFKNTAGKVRAATERQDPPFCVARGTAMTSAMRETEPGILNLIHWQDGRYRDLPVFLRKPIRDFKIGRY